MDLFCQKDGDDFYGDAGATASSISARRATGRGTIHDFSISDCDQPAIQDLLIP
jgi:hypothetical protein